MMVAPRASYLQIIEGASSLELMRARRRKAHQLALSFPSPDTLIAWDTSQISRDVLYGLFAEAPPTWLFDFRPSPRLDRLAGNREEALSLFNSKGVRYVDVFGTIKSVARGPLDRNPITWSPLIERLVAGSERKRGPFLGLFETRNELLNSGPYLAAALSSAVGRTIEFSG